MINNKLLIIFFSGVLILISGCLDEIQLDVPGMERETVVIQAKLIKGNPSTVTARVTNLFDFTPSSRAQIRVRSVTLLDSEGNNKDLSVDDRNTYSTTIYENDPDIDVDFGKMYQLKVNTIDGREFISDLEPLFPVPEPEEISFTTFAMDDDTTGLSSRFFRFNISTPTKLEGTEEKAKLRWDLESTMRVTDSPIDGSDPKTCYITTPAEVSKVKTVDGDLFSGDKISNYPIAELLVSSVFSEGFYLNVYQESLSEGAFEYWNQVGNVNDRSGNMFESPAGKIITNFKNTVESVEDEVFGYFYVTSQTVIRQYVSPEDAGNPRNQCPPLKTGQNPGRACNLPPQCCDCLSQSGSTLTKPDWWVE